MRKYIMDLRPEPRKSIMTLHAKVKYIVPFKNTVLMFSI